VIESTLVSYERVNETTDSRGLLLWMGDHQGRPYVHNKGFHYCCVRVISDFPDGNRSVRSSNRSGSRLRSSSLDINHIDRIGRYSLHITGDLLRLNYL